MEQFDGINFIPSETSESNKNCDCGMSFTKKCNINRHQRERELSVSKINPLLLPPSNNLFLARGG